MPTLVVESLTRAVGEEQHLVEIDLRFEAGQFHVLLGPSGAGKTSLLRVIAGLDAPTSGRVFLEDTADGSLRGKVAMVYQDFVNYPSLSVARNIAAPLRARRVPREQISSRVSAAAARVGLEDLLERLPAELSGGQQQRLAIARALVQEAQVVLLDEPLVNLDFKLREDLREEVRALFEGSQSIVVYASTDPAEALGFGGQVVVLDRGRVLQRGSGRALYDAPLDERVAAITSDPPINLWDAQLRGDRLELGGVLSLPLPENLAQLAEGALRLGLRPHHLSLERRDGCVPLTVRVDLAEVNGSTTCVHGHAQDLRVLSELSGMHDLHLGQELELFLDPRQLIGFEAHGAY